MCPNDAIPETKPGDCCPSCPGEVGANIFLHLKTGSNSNALIPNSNKQRRRKDRPLVMTLYAVGQCVLMVQYLKPSLVIVVQVVLVGEIIYNHNFNFLLNILTSYLIILI